MSEEMLTTISAMSLDELKALLEMREEENKVLRALRTVARRRERARRQLAEALATVK
jgi:hypothetical protein